LVLGDSAITNAQGFQNYTPDARFFQLAAKLRILERQIACRRKWGLQFGQQVSRRREGVCGRFGFGNTCGIVSVYERNPAAGAERRFRKLW